jgi:hypothetical protein
MKSGGKQNIGLREHWWICCTSFAFFVYARLAQSFTPVICGSTGLLVCLFVCFLVEAFEKIYESLATSRNFVCRV